VICRIQSHSILFPKDWTALALQRAFHSSRDWRRSRLSLQAETKLYAQARQLGTDNPKLHAELFSPSMSSVSYCCSSTHGGMSWEEDTVRTGQEHHVLFCRFHAQRVQAVNRHGPCIVVVSGVWDHFCKMQCMQQRVEMVCALGTLVDQALVGGSEACIDESDTNCPCTRTVSSFLFRFHRTTQGCNSRNSKTQTMDHLSLRVEKGIKCKFVMVIKWFGKSFKRLSSPYIRFLTRESKNKVSFLRLTKVEPQSFSELTALVAIHIDLTNKQIDVASIEKVMDNLVRKLKTLTDSSSLFDLSKVKRFLSFHVKVRGEISENDAAHAVFDVRQFDEFGLPRHIWESLTTANTDDLEVTTCFFVQPSIQNLKVIESSSEKEKQQFGDCYEFFKLHIQFLREFSQQSLKSSLPSVSLENLSRKK